jgi:hypothetical protein
MPVTVEIFVAGAPYLPHPALESRPGLVMRFVCGADRLAQVIPRTTDNRLARAMLAGAGR